jgi:hypothetical protein
MKYLEAWGTLIHEKNLKLKISCETPFKIIKSVRGLPFIPQRQNFSAEEAGKLFQGVATLIFCCRSELSATL